MKLVFADKGKMKDVVFEKVQYTKNFYEEHKEKLPAVSFVFGFLFDILMLDDIDSSTALLQQFIFIILLAGLLSYEMLEKHSAIEVPKINPKWDQYRNPLIHFLFGSLLSAYTLYYFISSSMATSIEFMIIMFLLLLINEYPRFQSNGTLTRTILLNFCMIAYTVYVLPILFGSIGHIVFLISLVIATGLQVAAIWYLNKRFTVDFTFLKKLLGAIFCVNLIIYFLYLVEVLPPVPLSIKKIGVYHEVKKEGDIYRASYERPWWGFWQNGAQSFVARPGDKVHLLAQIHSPTNFKETVYFHWRVKDSRGEWVTADKIPIPITGGKKTGYRGHGYKSNFSEGDWRVQVETSDGREIGRIYFVISNAPEREGREFKVDYFR